MGFMACRVKVYGSISAQARAVLTMMENQGKPEHAWTPFRSKALEECGYPHVESGHLEALYGISPRIVLEWELQWDGVHRWHVKYYQTEGMSGEAFSLVLWQGERKIQDLGDDVRVIASGCYMPVCDELVFQCRRVWHATAKQQVKEMHAREQARRAGSYKRGFDDIADRAAHMRRAYLRASAESPDSFWAGGATRNEDGTYALGAGPKGRNVTKAIDVNHREV